MDEPKGRPPRIGVSHQVLLIRSKGVEQEVTITDISAGGFSLEGQSGLHPGEHVYLKFRKQTNVQAEIRWVSGSKAGGYCLGHPS